MQGGDVAQELSQAVFSARQKIQACQAVRDIYIRLQAQIEARKPLCVASGKCCHFKSYGHRLYVTTLEIAAFANDFAGQSQPAPNRLQIIQDGCPLQSGKLCSVHAIRPFGCRIFFCDPSAGEWQQQQYELFHSELKQLHEQYDISYFYVEWRFALAACLVDTVPDRATRTACPSIKKD